MVTTVFIYDTTPEEGDGGNWRASFPKTMARERLRRRTWQRSHVNQNFDRITLLLFYLMLPDLLRSPYRHSTFKEHPRAHQRRQERRFVRSSKEALLHG